MIYVSNLKHATKDAIPPPIKTIPITCTIPVVSTCAVKKVNPKSIRTIPSIPHAIPSRMLSVIIRSTSPHYITNSINIKKKRVSQEVETMPRSIKVECHGCGRKVKAYTIKTWSRMDDDGDAYDKFGRFRMSNHKRGWFKPKCNRSGKIFKQSMGSFTWFP